MKTNKLSIAIALSLGFSYAVQAQFSAILDLSNLNGDNGFVINGENESDRSGSSVSTAGDINGDGIDDLIIGAYHANPDDNSFAGRSYVVFGSSTGLPNPLDLTSINGLNGFVINGENIFDRSGWSVSTAGDINSDGIDDLIIGAYGGNSYAGISYVVFGSSTGLVSPLNLSTLNGLNGFVINGANTNDRSGKSVSVAGDINGDGIDDLIVGAAYSDPNSNENAGSSYVVFGSSSSLVNPLELTDINGSNGFVINGERAGDFSGISVSSAGDVNGDNIDDLIIGANRADPNNNSYAGSSYVVFGSSSNLPNPLNLTSLNGLNGFAIHGESAEDRSGFSVASAGDVNGDGIDDVIIGAYGANSYAGRNYVVFGSSTGLPNPMNLTSLNGLNGFAIQGGNSYDYSGISASTTGDINGDGIDDLIIGAYRTSQNGNSYAGSSYVIFGSSSNFPNLINLSNLNGINGINGFTIHGESAEDRSGKSVGFAGDVNNDGIDDMIIGAYVADPNGINGAGSSYVVFGNDTIFINDFENQL